MTGAATLDIHSREDPAFRKPAAKMEFHIPGSFKFLVYEIIHAAPRIDEAGGNDGERSSLLDVSGSAKEALGRVEGN